MINIVNHLKPNNGRYNILSIFFKLQSFFRIIDYPNNSKSYEKVKSSVKRFKMPSQEDYQRNAINLYKMLLKFHYAFWCREKTGHFQNPQDREFFLRALLSSVFQSTLFVKII